MSLRASAVAWHQEGVRVVPTHSANGKDKVFFDKWTPIRDGPPQSMSDLAALSWDDATGMALIMGPPSGGLYSLDFDQSWAFGRACEPWGIKHPGEDVWWALMEKTYVEKTRRGHHVVFRCNREFSGQGAKDIAKDADGGVVCEMIPYKCVLHVAPTPGYSTRCVPSDVFTLQESDVAELRLGLRAILDDRPAAIVPSRPASRPSFKGNGITPWDVYDEKHSALDEALKHGFEVIRHRGEAVDLARPGQPEKGKVGATYNHNGIPKVFIFSQSTVSRAEQYLSAFDLFRDYTHGGDVKSAARAVRELYPKDLL